MERELWTLNRTFYGAIDVSVQPKPRLTLWKTCLLPSCERIGLSTSQVASLVIGEQILRFPNKVLAVIALTSNNRRV